MKGRGAGIFGRFLLLCLGVWLHAADTLVVATLVPSIVRDVGGVAFVAWTIALYQVGAIVAGAATAVLCRRRGLRAVLRTAAALYAAGCALAALAPDMGVLLAGRLVQGIGGGMLIALSSIAVPALFPERLWGRMFAVVAAIWGVGSLLGPLIGAAFADAGAWRAAFWCFAIQGAALCAAGAALPPIRPAAGAGAADAAFPVAPVGLLSAGALLVAASGVVRAPVSALALGGVGLALLAGAARLDRRAASPLLPRRLLRWRHPLGAGLLGVFALSVGTTGFWAYGPLLLAILFGADPLVSGFLVAGEALAWTAGTIAVAGLSPAAAGPLIRAGGVLVAAGAAGLALAVPSGSWAGMAACTLVEGFGFGICWPSVMLLAVRLADPGEGELAAAAPGNVQRIGYAVGAAASGVVANASGLREGATVAAARLAGLAVFAVFIPVLVLGAAGAWRLAAAAPARNGALTPEG